jgi:hypothetical protein
VASSGMDRKIQAFQVTKKGKLRIAILLWTQMQTHQVIQVYLMQIYLKLIEEEPTQGMMMKKRCRFNFSA